jgi:hypothetical protein
MLIVVYAAALAAGNAQGAVIEWSEGIGGNGHTYEAVAVLEGITWAEADAMATSMGGHLATITSDAENQWVFDNVATASVWFEGNGPWLGGILVDSSWEWVTGEVWDYTAWAPGEPNNGAGEPVVQYWNATPSRAPTWSNWRTDRQAFGLIVEYIPTPSSVALFAVGGFAATRRRRAG